MKVQIDIFSKIVHIFIVVSFSLPLLGEGFYENDIINTLELKFEDDN